MHNLDLFAITQKFKLAGTNTLVILDGIYQPRLSCASSEITFINNTLRFAQDTTYFKPYHLLFVTSVSCDTTYTINAAQNSMATFIEEHICFAKDNSTQQIKTQINLETGSTITYAKLQLTSKPHITQHITTEILQKTNSKLISAFVTSGVQNLHDNILVNLAGEYATYTLRGINILNMQQTISDNIEIQHNKAHSTSTVLVKNILASHATSNFKCRIIAKHTASKSTAHVKNKNLLLAASALACSSPIMEVSTDDIDCAHGATVGQLDEAALFYLRSRGISHDLAMHMLLDAFAQEIIACLPDYPRFKTCTEKLLDHGRS